MQVRRGWKIEPFKIRLLFITTHYYFDWSKMYQSDKSRGHTVSHIETTPYLTTIISVKIRLLYILQKNKLKTNNAFDDSPLWNPQLLFQKQVRSVNSNRTQVQCHLLPHCLNTPDCLRKLCFDSGGDHVTKHSEHCS